MFDLDGTIINSEFTHYSSYKELLGNNLTYREYQKIFHSDLRKKYVSGIDKSRKEQLFMAKYTPEYIAGFEELCKELILLGKEIIIVTNSSSDRINFIKEKHPFLQRIQKWYGNSDTCNPKPHADNYVRAITESGASLNEIIIFEDSYTGFKAIESLNVAKIFICSPDYYYYDEIKGEKYEDYTSIMNNPIRNTTEQLACIKIDTYINELTKHKENIANTVSLLYSVLKDKINLRNIFFLGIGKCGHICNKIVSTWASIGIRVFYNRVEDLFHGEFAKINSGDIIFFVSNSGNTQELLHAAAHLKSNFDVMKIGLTFKQTSLLKEFMDIYIPITSGLTEACHLNSAPTVSSALFMILLDSVGTLLAEHVLSLNKSQFKIFHPGGILGYTKPLDTVVICACGKGTRLMPLTANIPKYCVNIDNFNILVHIVNYWKEYTDNIILVIEEKNNSLTQFYMNTLHVKYSIRNVDLQNQENSYTLYHALNDKASYSRILITWCDLFPSCPIPYSAFRETTVFTHGSQSRYICDSDKIVKQTGGNVVGIYYFDKFTPMRYDNDKQDICDILPKYCNNIRPYNIENIHDVGDMDKLLTYQKMIRTTNISRYFNCITEISPDRIKKESIHEDGNALIKREMKYYNAIRGLDLPFPDIYDQTNTSFIMQKCKGVMLRDKEPTEVLDSVFCSLHRIHSKIKKVVTEDVFYRDLHIEFTHKIKERIRQISPIIDHFGPITHINGIKVHTTIDNIIDNLYADIKKYNIEREYCILHGDCNFSNIFMDISGELTFIDPRGYYGNTFLFGYKYYDYSKVLYALSGYDAFNSAENFYVTLNSHNLEFKMPELNIDQYKPIFIKHGIDWDICLKMCILHWLGLSQYISNNIHKSVAAYHHGIEMYYKYCISAE